MRKRNTLLLLFLFFSSNENTSTIEINSLQRHHNINSTDRLSFFHTCLMNGNESLYFLCIQSKRTRLLAYRDHILSAYPITILSYLTINNLITCDLFFKYLPIHKKFDLIHINHK
jgi:hypothetical protein